MTHLSETADRLTIEHVTLSDVAGLQAVMQDYPDVCVLWLPALEEPNNYGSHLQNIGCHVAEAARRLGDEATLVTIGEIPDLVDVQAHMPENLRYQHWITIKRNRSITTDNRSLAQDHYGALIQTRYSVSLRHAKTRLPYRYCPACDKTTKDYGGKKHTYHEYGTLMSDVWRDIDGDLRDNITPVATRFADFFGISPYRKLRIVDCRNMDVHRPHSVAPDSEDVMLPHQQLPDYLTNQVIHGDCLEQLRNVPDDCIDFAFADPPYNLKKKYVGYTDDLEIQEYFDWCDRWISEMARVLKPGRTFALLNLPLWAVRHFLHMKTVLTYQNWLVWDALGFPVRFLMPAHYTILCFTKGQSRGLPGLTGSPPNDMMSAPPSATNILQPLAEDYCLRSSCIKQRRATNIDDRSELTDVWGDIHRLKHNSRRVDHPTQLPPRLLYRLIAIFTNPDETVLDCFNGSGTTTLAAAQMQRKYLGIELSEDYRNLSAERHCEIHQGLDPFRKSERLLTAKNSPVPRVKKQIYEIPKRTLQLEVRRVAEMLGRLPDRDELAKHGQYAIKYYDDYFVSWGEVCAAARTTGMVESRVTPETFNTPLVKQLGFDMSDHEDLNESR